MLEHTVDTAARDLDEARAKIEATRAALQAVLDAQGGGQSELKTVIARLERMAAEVERVEGSIGGRVPAGI